MTARAATMRAMSSKPTIYYTETDEAPMLATYSLLPVVKRMVSPAGINIEKPDISLAGRIIAEWSDVLDEAHKGPDELKKLGGICLTPEANIIKLPNISASVMQLNAAIAELRTKGYDVPLYCANPKTDKEIEVNKRYSKVLGSAVNPVLREGNSDRRVAAPVKNYAKKNPHKMGAWMRSNKSHVAHMRKGDFYASEKSAIMDKAGKVKIEHVSASGEVTVLKPEVKVQAGEIIDGSFMSVKMLREFFEAELQESFKEQMMVSIHLKATMMKVSDPVIFGHMVTVYFKSVYEKYGAEFVEIGHSPNNGIGDLFERLKRLPDAKRQEIESAIKEVYENRPWLAMVNSDKGITNLHVPNDVIIDASMPVVIRESGSMYNRDGELEVRFNLSQIIYISIHIYHSIT
jgi:isocitrate dehydrogenase